MRTTTILQDSSDFMVSGLPPQLNTRDTLTTARGVYVSHAIGGLASETWRQQNSRLTVNDCNFRFVSRFYSAVRNSWCPHLSHEAHWDSGGLPIATRNECDVRDFTLLMEIAMSSDDPLAVPTPTSSPTPEIPNPAAPNTKIPERQPGPSVFTQLGCFLYNHNPFYLISACLTLIAIHSIFGVEVVGELKTASVLIAIGCYTALLGLTGVLIVRYGKVWEDARTIILAVILLLMATSVCTDELLMLAPTAALRLILGSLLFAIVLCETMIRGLKIRFGAEFRVPLFLLLSILFVYPYFCASEVRDLTSVQVQWRVLGFPFVFGAALLSIWPAIRRGSVVLNGNGTPWNWPLYPWCLFIVIAAAGAFRCRILTESFDPMPGLDVTFGTYYLIPILFVVALLVIEMGFVEKRPGLIRCALYGSLGLVWLALPGHGLRYYKLLSLHEEFYQTVATSLGSPVFWTLVLLVVLYGVVWLRGEQAAKVPLTVALAGLAWVGPSTTGSLTFTQFTPWPVVLIGAFLAWTGWNRETCHRFFVGVGLCLSALPTVFRWMAWEGVSTNLTCHAAVLSLAVTGLLYRDDLARFLERTVCVSIPILAAVAVLFPQRLQLDMYQGAVYSVTLTILAFLAGWRGHRRTYLWAGGAVIAGACGEVALTCYRNLVLAVGRKGMWALSWSVASFVLAVLISVSKGGHLNQIRQIRAIVAFLRHTCGIESKPDATPPISH